jgi:serine/threonine-protein kinase
MVVPARGPTDPGDPGPEAFAETQLAAAHSRPDGPVATEFATSRDGATGRAVAVAAALTAGLPPLAHDRYRIGPEIGRGGVGVVHRGWDIRLAREVAFKALMPEHVGRPQVTRRFLDEAGITCRLHHPGVVSVHDLGRLPDGRPCIVMSLVEGENLDGILARRARTADGLTALLGVFEKVCEVIAHAHDLGVIHRDLKPANVRVGPFGVVKVMDWGLGKVLLDPASEHPPIPAPTPGERADPDDGDAFALAGDLGLAETQVGTVFGTPAYLAPEQARGATDAVDERADVFGLGAILCEILTGRPPFAGAGHREAFARAARGDLGPALARLDAAEAPADLVGLARQCLDPDPARRPRSAVPVAEAISRYVRWDQTRAERDLARFFDLSLDLLCIADTAGTFLRVNENFSRVLGYSAEMLTSRPYLDFVHPDDRAATLEQLQGLARGEPCLQFVNRYRHASGAHIWLEWVALRIPEEHVVYAVARNVTERMRVEDAHRRAEESRQHLARLVDSAQVAIISCDLGGRVQSWNRAAEALFGYNAAEMLGRTIDVLVPAGCLTADPPVLDHIAHCERVEQYEAHRQAKDGRVLKVDITLSPVRDESGAIVGISKIVRDLGAPRPAPDAPR